MQVSINYRKAAAHNDKAAKADTGTAKSIEEAAWPVIYKAKRSKAHKDLEDVDDVDMGEVSIAGPSTEVRGWEEDGGGEDDCGQDSAADQEGGSGEDGCEQDSGTDQEGGSGEDGASGKQGVFQ